MQSCTLGLQYGAVARNMPRTWLTRLAQVVQRGSGSAIFFWLTGQWFLMRRRGGRGSFGRASGGEGGHDSLFHGVEGLDFAGPAETGQQCPVAANSGYTDTFATANSATPRGKAAASFVIARYTARWPQAIAETWVSVPYSSRFQPAPLAVVSRIGRWAVQDAVTISYLSGLA